MNRMAASRRDVLHAAVAGGIAATVGSVATKAPSADPLDALTFYHRNDTGWPHAHSGDALDPVKEWEFSSAKCASDDMWLIVAHHRPAPGEFQRFAWPTTPDGEVVPLDRPPTMGEIRDFAAVCLAGLNAPMVPGTPIRTDRARVA